MPRDLPKFVHKEITRHGKVSYYFRRGRAEPRIRLPDPSSPEFREAYNVAYDDGSKHIPCSNKPVSAEELRRLRVLVALHNAVRQARNRARRKGVPFDLTNEWVTAQVAEQQFQCALSGVPFYREFKGSTKHHPYAPSLDRIEPKLGYVVENVRIVIFAVNMGLADWGEKVFRIASTRRRIQALKGAGDAARSP